jgi:hypothetical protein
MISRVGIPCRSLYSQNHFLISIYIFVLIRAWWHPRILFRISPPSPAPLDSADPCWKNKATGIRIHTFYININPRGTVDLDMRSSFLQTYNSANLEMTHVDDLTWAMSSSPKHPQKVKGHDHQRQVTTPIFKSSESHQHHESWQAHNKQHYLVCYLVLSCSLHSDAQEANRAGPMACLFVNA